MKRLSTNKLKHRRWETILVAHAAQIIIFVSFFYLITKLPGTPYNVRELFLGSTILDKLIFSFALLWSLNPILFITECYYRKTINLLFFYTMLLGHAAFLYALLRYSVPIESIHDILGGPILKWPWELELMGRFTFLYCLISWLMAGAYMLSITKKPFSAKPFLYWFVTSIPVLLLFHWVVVIEASTDNLTELMRGGGSWTSTLSMTIWLFILFYTINLLSAGIINTRKFSINKISIIIFSIPVNYGLIIQATEPLITKYHKTFSALQFLLSTDRTHYLNKSLIMYYYMACYILLFIVIALIMFPAIFTIKKILSEQ